MGPPHHPSRGLYKLSPRAPNRNVDLAFRASTLILKSGQIVTGLVLREEGEVVVVADSQGKELRIPKSNIEERSVSQLSPMPANLIEQIAEGDFRFR